MPYNNQYNQSVATAVRGYSQKHIDRENAINDFSTTYEIPSVLEASVLKDPAVHGGGGFAAARVQDLGYRWGSCGKGHRLYFHWKTILLPARIAEYVVVHEMAHLHEPHHTPEYWRRVERAMPDYERRKAWLAERGRDARVQLRAGVDKLISTYRLAARKLSDALVRPYVTDFFEAGQLGGGGRAFAEELARLGDRTFGRRVTGAGAGGAASGAACRCALAHALPCGRIHRFLRGPPSCDQCRHDVSRGRERAAAELAAYSHWL